MNSKDRRGLGLIGTTIVVGVLVILFGGGPYVLNVLQTSFLVGNSTSTNPLNQAKQVIDQLTQKGGTEQKQVEQLSSSSTIDTSTWKTYRNEEYGFEFMYPTTWKAEVFANDSFRGEPLLSVDFHDPKETSEMSAAAIGEGFGLRMMFYVGSNPSSLSSGTVPLSLDKWIEEYTYSDGTKEEIAKITIAGREAVKNSYVDSLTEEFGAAYFIANKNRVYVFDSKSTSTLDGVISTFKFTK